MPSKNERVELEMKLMKARQLARDTDDLTRDRCVTLQQPPPVVESNTAFAARYRRLKRHRGHNLAVSVEQPSIFGRTTCRTEQDPRESATCSWQSHGPTPARAGRPSTSTRMPYSLTYSSIAMNTWCRYAVTRTTTWCLTRLANICCSMIPR